jgi:hypothetical protein
MSPAMAQGTAAGELVLCLIVIAVVGGAILTLARRQSPLSDPNDDFEGDGR